MIEKKTFDDGNWNWHYECKFISPTNYTSDWYYEISFETKYGGHLSDEAISCYYWQTDNLLQISMKGVRIDFYAENFHDIEVILKPLIKANCAIPYPIYKSITAERKDKLDKINKKSK